MNVSHWFKDAIIYELHVRSFQDSNSDGIGDFRGLLQRLGYLADLGVTAVWLLPFYPSPLRDDGYDIADYYSVNPSYGTLTDFQEFLAEAHRGTPARSSCDHGVGAQPYLGSESLVPAGSACVGWFARARLLRVER
jgi:maltose alpha-D-glucosyltransferase/alpha-amylase